MITEKQRAYNREHYQKWLLNHKERRDELNRECAKRKRARGIMDYVKIGVDFRKTHPLASGCHIKVYEAVKSGKLKRKPCKFCKNPKVHAHHEDYTKPLEVVWLCNSCHRKVHLGIIKL